ncbi:MAG TPA: helix-turn-helix domain-containing protein [Sedimentisphaerales bacterium]|nr:helix-turn-helix domain-containing protein [Sedimentisphaerales bacterium]
MADTLMPLLVDFTTASKMLSISRATLYSMSSDGRLGVMVQHIGRRALLNRQELENWVNAGMPSREKWMLQNEKA